MKRMKARFPGRCADCGAGISVGDQIRYSKETGAVCDTSADCRDYADSRAEQAAEMRMEAWAEARFTGTTYCFFENQDYARGVSETRYAQQAGPAGSAAREAAYMEMEMAAYNRGEDY